jgi:flagellar assembly protein FliH
MSATGRVEPPATTSRSLRRLAHQPAVATTYQSREADSQAIESDRVAAVRQGYADGYADGSARVAAQADAATAEVSRRADSALAGLSAAITSAQDRDLGLRAEMQVAASSLAFALLEMLLGRETALAANPGREAVTRALALDEGREPARVRLNPLDLETLQGHALDLGRVATFEPDAQVEPGGAMVEIGHAVLDGQLGPALERVRRVLLRPPETGADDDRAA